MSLVIPYLKIKTKTYEVNEVIVGTNKQIKTDSDLQEALHSMENPIAPERLKRLQQQDANIETLKHKLNHNRLDKEYYCINENGLLTWKVVNGGHEFLQTIITSHGFHLYGLNRQIPPPLQVMAIATH